MSDEDRRQLGYSGNDPAPPWTRLQLSMLRRRSANPLVERIDSRCCAPEISVTRHPLNLGLRRLRL